MSDDFNIDAGIDVDEGEAQREFAKLGAIIEKAMGRAFANASKQFATELNRALRGTGAQSGFTRGFKDMGDAAKAAGGDFRRLDSDAKTLDQDIEALRKRSEAMRDTLNRAGARPELFAVIDTELDKVLRLQRDFNDNLETISRDPNLLRGYEVTFQSLRSTIFREVSGINETLRSLSTTQDREGQRANLILKAQLREQEQLREAARSQFVVTSQREGAQLLAETRASNQRRLQQERQFQRTRVEVLRFTLNQIRVLERAVGSVFRGTASIIAGSVARIEGTVQRMGQVFRRGNREVNDGLQPTLLSRERLIERSFDRQNTLVTQSLIRQSRTIQRFERQASTGLAGIATGRSTAGALFGGGLAVGGGFLLLDRLRAGFRESVDLNESLNRTRQIFGDVSTDIEAFAANSVEALFSTGSAALRAAGDFGIFGRAAGLTGQPLADFSKRLTVLATDLASFNNTEVDDAVTALAASLRGEQEPIRRYGVLLNDAVLQQAAFSAGITESVRKLTPAERILAAYNEILSQTVVQQGDAARTADDFANSSRRAAAATTETFAAIAGALVPLATFLTNFSFVVLPRITAFIEGNVGPGLEVLRDGLIGAGAALAGLLAARGAGEALRFLSIGLRAVLTPMGLFVAAIAGIGAAINIFRDRSPEFASAIRTISAVLEDVLGRAIDLGQAGLERLSSLVEDRVLPALETFARFVGRTLRTAIEFGIGFIVTVLVPGFQRFAALVVDTVLPALADFARFLLARVVPALRTLQDVAGETLGAILPYLEPAIEGFGRLAEVITASAIAAGSGDFSGIVDSLRTFVSNISAAEVASAAGLGVVGTAIGGPIGGAIGIALGLGLGNSLQRIGGLAIDAIEPQLDRVADFVSGYFTADRLEGAAIGFLEFVRRVGRVIGSVVSDPKFIAALELIVAAGVATGFQFIRGLVEGIIDNIPDVSRMLGRQLQVLFTEALGFAVSDPATFATIFIGIFAARAFLSRVRIAAAGTGEVAATGFFGGMIRATRQSFQGNEFARAFFGGIDTAFRRNEDQLLATEARYANRLKLLGETVDPSRSFKTQFDDLVTKYGQASVAGASFRESTNRIFNDVRTGVAGVGLAISGNISQGFGVAGGALRSFGTNVRDLFRNSLADLRAGGFQLGTALGGAIVSGVGAALAGQALGTADSGLGQGLGLAGIISAALFGAAQFGGATPIGVLVGGTIAGLGLITAAISNSGDAAKTAAAEIDEYVEALRGISGAAAGAAAAEAVLANLESESRDVRDILESVGFNARAFADEVIAGAFDATDAIGLLAPSFGNATSAVIAELARLETEGIGPVEALQLAVNRTSDSNLRALQEAIEGMDRDQVLAIADAFDVLLDESGELRSGLEDAQQFERFRRNAVAATDAAAAGFVVVDRALDSVARSGSSAAGFGDRVRGAAEAGFAAISRGIVTLDEFGNKFVDVGRDITSGLRDPLDPVNQALQRLSEQRLDGLNTQIQGVRDSLIDARDAVQETLDGILLLSGGPLEDPLQGAIDQLVLAAPNVAEALQRALTDAPRGVDFDEAQIRETLRPFQDQLGAVFTQAFETFGADLTPEKLAEILGPIQETLNRLTIPTEVTDAEGNVTVQEVAVPREVRDRLQGVIDSLLGNPTVNAQVQQLAVRQEAVTQLEQDLIDLEAQLPVEVVFSADQVEAALLELFGQVPINLDPASVLARQLGLNPVTFQPNTPSFGQGGVVGAELQADADLRAAVAALVARDVTPTQQQPTTVVQGDVVAQKVENQTFATADRAEVAAAAQARQMRLASGAVFTQVLAGIS